MNLITLEVILWPLGSAQSSPTYKSSCLVHQIMNCENNALMRRWTGVTVTKQNLRTETSVIAQSLDIFSVGHPKTNSRRLLPLSSLMNRLRLLLLYCLNLLLHCLKMSRQYQTRRSVVEDQRYSQIDLNSPPTWSSVLGSWHLCLGSLVHGVFSDHLQ